MYEVFAEDERNSFRSILPRLQNPSVTNVLLAFEKFVVVRQLE